MGVWHYTSENQMLKTEYKKCKFDPCAYKHIENQSEIENLKKVNEALLEIIKNIDKNLNILNEKENKAKSMIEKLDQLEEKYELLIKERDTGIGNLDVNAYTKSVDEEIATKINSQNEKIEKLEKVNEENMKKIEF